MLIGREREIEHATAAPLVRIILMDSINPAVIKAIQNTTGLQSQTNTPSGAFTPVSDVNPAHNRVCNIVRSTQAVNATAATIYTTPTDQDFYLTAANLAVMKDATSTSLFSSIQVLINGAQQRTLRLNTITLTADSRSQEISFPVPIKIDRGTNITIENNTGIANITTGATIYGFTVSNEL